MDDEPAVGQVLVSELQRFKGRMKVNPIPVLLLALVMTAGALFVFARKPTMYTARVILRISEGALTDYRGAVVPRGELKDYIYSFALSDALLMSEIIDKHGIYSHELGLFGATGALDELRDGLSVEIYHNFFHFSKRHESTPRSLRIAISYQDKNPEFAYKVAVLLSDLVVDVERNKRLQEVRYAADNAHQVLDAVAADYDERDELIASAMSNLAEAELAGEGVAAAMARVEIASLARTQLMKGRELEGLQRKIEQIDFNRQLEENHLGIVFELAGRIKPVPKPPPGPLLLGLVGLVCFGIFVPVCAIGLGTFDSRLHESGDVHRLGMPALGHIPAFRGDDIGSLRQRGALEPPTLLGRLGLRPRRVRRSDNQNRVASTRTTHAHRDPNTTR
ncbi:hypothetical protein Hoch_0206 [Haliangium ochraceum DSM 14365]|uniref:Uncharacterized protein n=2 Tax=Haliangium ochraceum TaxID=80816 RepID=D0LHI5_HALO1|nr:hypothetical protein Hoch_0206 [Haliangium ochraceum DSM 14365]